MSNSLKEVANKTINVSSLENFSVEERFTWFSQNLEAVLSDLFLGAVIEETALCSKTLHERVYKNLARRACKKGEKIEQGYSRLQKFNLVVSKDEFEKRIIALKGTSNIVSHLAALQFAKCPKISDRELVEAVRKNLHYLGFSIDFQLFHLNKSAPDLIPNLHMLRVYYLGLNPKSPDFCKLKGSEKKQWWKDQTDQILIQLFKEGMLDNTLFNIDSCEKINEEMIQRAALPGEPHGVGELRLLSNNLHHDEESLYAHYYERRSVLLPQLKAAFKQVNPKNLKLSESQAIDLFLAGCFDIVKREESSEDEFIPPHPIVAGSFSSKIE